jgi:hypothetical protein
MTVRWMDMRVSFAKTLLLGARGVAIMRIERPFYFVVGEPAMKSHLRWLLAAAIAFAAHAATAQTVNVSGVKYDETVDVHGAKLHLNGAGVRYKFVVKVYTAGLYLPKKAATTEEVLSMPGAKKMSITMLRDIDSSELGKLFTRGVEDNMEKSAFSKLIPGLVRMSQLFTDIKHLKAGDNFTIEWIPGTGTVISVKGQQQGEPFKEPEFYNALLRIWLGPAPADWKLKDALLGKAAA